MKISFEQVTLVIISAIAAAAGIMLLKSPEVAGTLTAGFTLALGGFLGVDLAKTIVRTSTLKKGQWEPLQRGRYYLGLTLIAGLFAVTLWRASEGFDFQSAQQSLALGFGVVITELVAGIQGNKIATLKGPEHFSTVEAKDSPG